ncbi:MAG: hypothetical protein LAO79_29125, partial [Acidobacteriia bacterium]|nr:hypothetical protein [Terriglobia bacterium]
MRSRFILCAALIAAAAWAQPAKKAIPRTPDGHPDLQGIWTNATITPLERPAGFASKPTLSDAEAREFEKKDSASNTLDGDVDNN